MSTSSSRSPGLRLLLLGPPMVEVDGQPLAVDTRKAIALLAVLALAPGPHERQALAALLWSEGDDAHAQSALRRTLSTLHGALGHRWLQITRETVALGDEGWICDVTAFDSAIAAGRAGDTSAFSNAVALVRGDLMQGFSLRDSPAFDDWLGPRADSLRRNLAHALEQLAEAALATTDHATAITLAERWLATDPLQEAAHRLLMRAFVASGDRTAALRQYRDCVRILDAELGVPPIDETRALYRTIRGEAAAPAEGEPALPTPAAPRSRPFVGRSSELRLLSRLLRAASRTGCLLLIEGEAGAGKSRLIEEMLARSQGGGTTVLVARCFESESSLPYATTVELLKAAHLASTDLALRVSAPELLEASRLLPALAPSATAQAPSESPGAQARLLEGVATVLAAAVSGPAPGMVVVDDAQWLDGASTEVLGYLARRLRQRNAIVLVLAIRSGADLSDTLVRVIGEAERQGTVARMPLRRLSEGEVAAWVRESLGEGTPAEFATRLAQESEGLPLLVAEYLAEAPATGAGAGAWTLPASARDLLQQRISGLPDIEWQVLSAASVAGRSSGFELMQSAGGRSEDETLYAVEHLLRRGLIRERPDPNGAPVWDFTHDKLRQLVYDQLTATRRRILHRRIAEALLREGGQPGLVAQHFDLAGDQPRAATWFRQAGDAARAVFAHDEALANYEAALALGGTDPVQLHVAMGDVHLLHGSFDDALVAYEAAASIAPAAELPRIEHLLGRVYMHIGEWTQAEDHFAAASSDRLGTAAFRASVLADWSQSALRRGDAALAEKRAAEALTLATEGGDEGVLARARITRGILARRHADLALASTELSLALDAAIRSGNVALRASALNNLALVALDAHEPQTALRHGKEALDLVRWQGDRHALAAIHSNLADFYWAAGEAAEAEAQLRESVAIYADIGVVGGEPQPEIWKLVDW